MRHMWQPTPSKKSKQGDGKHRTQQFCSPYSNQCTGFVSQITGGSRRQLSVVMIRCSPEGISSPVRKKRRNNDLLCCCRPVTAVFETANWATSGLVAGRKISADQRFGHSPKDWPKYPSAMASFSAFQATRHTPRQLLFQNSRIQNWKAVRIWMSDVVREW